MPRLYANENFPLPVVLDHDSFGGGLVRSGRLPDLQGIGGDQIERRYVDNLGRVRNILGSQGVGGAALN